MEADFEIQESLAAEDLNIVHSYALMPGLAYSFENLESPEKINFLKQLSSSIDPNREDKAVNAYSIMEELEKDDLSGYNALINSFSDFFNIKDSVRQRINCPENLKEKNSWLLSCIIFGYSTCYSNIDEFWYSFNENQKRIDSKRQLISYSDLNAVFGDGSALLNYKINYMNNAPSEPGIVYILKYINVGNLFTGSSPVIDPTLMKDCEIQSYRISGSITPKYYSGDAYGLLTFNPNLNECQQVVVSGETGFLQYPCAKTSIRPRELKFNQLLYDGPYTSGDSSVASDGVSLLRSIENETYSADRFSQIKKNNYGGTCFASYSDSWIFDEFSGVKNVTFLGDVLAASSADTLKSFPDSSTGAYHFLGSQIFQTGSGQKFYYTGFSPVFFRLNDSENDEIYSGLEINLFDKKRNSGVLMAYSWSLNSGILTSHSIGEEKYPSLNISNATPTLPFIGVSVDFSSETFKVKPSVKFNFGHLAYSEKYGSYINASDFSFTGFNFSGKNYFELGSGKLTYSREIKNSNLTKVSEAFSTNKETSSQDEFMLQKALGFSFAEDSLSKDQNEKIGDFYGVKYKYYNDSIEGMDAPINPPNVEHLAQDGIIGDPTILKYINRDLTEKQIFGPLDSASDANLGTGFIQKITTISNPNDEDYKYVRNLNPARYYSGLFASNRKVFLYPNAEKIYKSGSNSNVANQEFPYKIAIIYEIQENYSKTKVNFSRFQAGISKGFESLKNDIWVDENFSHPNAYRGGGGYGPPIPVWTFKPAFNNKELSKNLNGIVYEKGLETPLIIQAGKIQNIKNQYFFDINKGSDEYVDYSTAPISSTSAAYEISVDLSYMMPIKSLSDFKNYPSHAHKSFVSTGDTSVLMSYPLVAISGKWDEALNKAMNDEYGQDVLFEKDLDANLADQNLSGDSWNGFYIKSGEVFFPLYGRPYRARESDVRLFLIHDNAHQKRVFLRNSDIFPAFINNPYDVSFNGKSLAEYCFASEREKNNFIDSYNSCFEITGLSLFDGGLDKTISFKIERTGKLYHCPEATVGNVFLPEITSKQYNDIIALYPELNGYSFYSGIDEYSKSVSGYYLDYKETSEIKIIPKSYIINKTKFPKNDEIFEFETSGMIGINAELSYNSQEESCVVTHGIKIEERENEKDKFQEAGFKFSYASPVLKNKLGSASTFDFATRQVSRKNKIISGKNTFLNKNNSSPYYHNHFYLGVLPEFCHFHERSLIGNLGQDNLLYPNSEIISSSSYDYEEEYEDGSNYIMEKIDKIYDVVESKRFYDSFFCDSITNSGLGFIETLNTGSSINSNEQCKQFWAPNNTAISDLELGDKISFISETKDREVDLSGIKQ